MNFDLKFEFIMNSSSKHTRSCIVEPLSINSYVRAVPKVLQVCSKRCLIILFTWRPVHDRGKPVPLVNTQSLVTGCLLVCVLGGTHTRKWFLTSPRICLIFSFFIYMYIHCMYIVQKRGLKYNNVLVPYTSMQRFVHKSFFLKRGMPNMRL